MLCVVFFAAVMVISGLLYVKSKDVYNEYTDQLDTAKYPVKKLLPLGLKLMDVMGYKYNTKYDGKILRRLGELHGTKSAGIYLRIHWANKVVFVLLMVLLVSFFGSIIWLQSVSERDKAAEAVLINGSELEKQAFGEGSREVRLNADITKDGLKQQKQYRIRVPEAIPPSDEAAVNKALERLGWELIKGDNASPDSVSRSLNLRKSYEELGNTGVSIEWRSSDTDIVAADGKVVLPTEDNPIKITVTAVVAKGSISEKKTFDVQIRRAPLTDEQIMENVVKELGKKVEEIKRDTSKTGRVKLPTTSSGFSDVVISWLPLQTDKADSGMSAILFALVLSGLVVYLLDRDINTKVEKRRLRIRYHFPEFLNKLVLLINAGMTAHRAMEKIVSDSKADSILYEELKTTMADIAGGKPEHQAFEEFANRCKVPEISKFVSVMLQNLVKGNAELVSILLLLSNECWEMRKSTARRLGEEASTKLLLPMMLMLIAILMIVATPAVLSMRGF